MLKALKRFKENWLEQLADKRVSEDESIKRAYDYIEKLQKDGVVGFTEFHTLRSNISWLESHIKARRAPVAVRWFAAAKWWCIYFGIQVRTYAQEYWEELTYRPEPEEYPSDLPLPEEKVLPIQKD